MARSSDSRAYAVLCPHCGNDFEAELLSGDSERHKGFKCPHCRLFVAYSRVEEQDEQRAEDADGNPS
jgi:phage terminase large subunit GpA-like protein